VLERSNTSNQEDADPLHDRLAGAPISWGVSELPGWGVILPPEVVLADMHSLGLGATELGPEGWLPSDAGRLRELLDGYGLRLVGGFVPLVLHDRIEAHATRETAERAARLLAAAGAQVLVSSAAPSPAGPARGQLEAGERTQMVESLGAVDEIADRHGLTHALHPHVGTRLETPADVEYLTEASSVRWCLDTGHLTLIGIDPLLLAMEASARIAHVHLKDIELSLADGLRSGTVSHREATRQGVFRPLGSGGVAVGDVVRALESSGYEGWYVIEQDLVVAEPDSGPLGHGPADDVEASIEYLRRVGAGLAKADQEHEEVT
jgi:inosose dehydratase